MIWGALFILVGVFIILHSVFGINLPVMKIAIAMFVIFAGMKILMGPRLQEETLCGSLCNPNQGKVIFNSAHVVPANLSQLSDNEFSTIFARGELDLTNAGFESHANLKIITFFGKVKVLLPSNVNLVSKVNSIIGQVELPGESGSTSAFAKTLNVEVNNVFGATHIEKK